MLLTIAFSLAASSVSAQELSIAGQSPWKRAPEQKEVLKEKVEFNKRSNEDSDDGRPYIVQSGQPVWSRNYNAGIRSLREGKYQHAEQMFLAGIKEAKTSGAPASQLVNTRLALGQLYLYMKRFVDANEIYQITLAKAQAECGKESIETAECYVGLALTSLAFQDKGKARQYAEDAVQILNEIKKTDGQVYGRALHALAKVMVEHGWYQEAEELFGKSKTILQQHPGYKQLLLADVLRDEALFYHKMGARKNATDLYEKSYRIKEAAVVPDQPPSVAGEVRFEWEQGSTRAQEIIDSEFPLRYISANGIRVATTVIDLWEIMGVLVTVTNVSDHQQEFELGKVVLEKVDPGHPNKHKNVIPEVNPKAIDKVQKELSMWTKTHTRPWLANIQKTRNVRGLVPSVGHDMFMGPNVFGVYGHWEAISHTVPIRAGIRPSREGLVVGASPKDQALPGLLRSNEAQFAGLTPVWLEPFESRTGYLFYLNQRDTELVIKVPVGNAIFEIPFHTHIKGVH